MTSPASCLVMSSREPTYSFTIPSVSDGTLLDCRLYHPRTVSSLAASRARGIMIAHPYAPLGGSYDDYVVNIVVDEFLASGFIAGTFNFR